MVCSLRAANTSGALPGTHLSPQSLDIREAAKWWQDLHDCDRLLETTCLLQCRAQSTGDLRVTFRGKSELLLSPIPVTLLRGVFLFDQAATR